MAPAQEKRNIHAEETRAKPADVGGRLTRFKRLILRGPLENSGAVSRKETPAAIGGSLESSSTKKESAEGAKNGVLLDKEKMDCWVNDNEPEKAKGSPEYLPPACVAKSLAIVGAVLGAMSSVAHRESIRGMALFASIYAVLFAITGFCGAALSNNLNGHKKTRDSPANPK